MICAEKTTVRTPAENIYLEEMVMEDANFLIMDDAGDDSEDIIPDDTNTGLFDNSSTSDDMLLDDEQDDEDLDRILGLI